MDNLPGEKERHSLSHLHGLFPRDPIIPLPRLNPRHLVVYVLHILIDILHVLIDILLWRVGDYIDLHVVSVIVYTQFKKTFYMREERFI